MIQSMTGFSSYESSHEQGVLQVELRSVNQRYLELQLKLDDYHHAQEPLVREKLKEKLGRGKVECRVNLAKAMVDVEGVQLNDAALTQIAETVKTAARYFPQTQAVDILDVLKMPGVLTSKAVNEEQLVQHLQEALDVAIDALIAARLREGEKLKAMILERLAEVGQLVAEVKPKLPAMVVDYRKKLLAKLQEAQLSHDEERIRQEITLYTQRIDVDEELSRLGAHIDEVKRILSVGGLAGKKLDFLMQEMNREANTLGAKSVSIETIQISVQLKVLIEQMREQIQNIE